MHDGFAFVVPRVCSIESCGVAFWEVRFCSRDFLGDFQCWRALPCHLADDICSLHIVAVGVPGPDFAKVAESYRSPLLKTSNLN